MCLAHPAELIVLVLQRAVDDGEGGKFALILLDPGIDDKTVQPEAITRHSDSSCASIGTA